MKLESQVVSLELAKRLKELGVKADSIFVWFEESTPAKPFPVRRTDLKERFRDSKVPAYTSAELGEMLPTSFQNYRKKIGGRQWVCTDPHGSYKRPRGRFSALTEADARAKMLIHLIKNNLISLP